MILDVSSIALVCTDRGQHDRVRLGTVLWDNADGGRRYMLPSDAYTPPRSEVRFRRAARGQRDYWRREPRMWPTEWEAPRPASDNAHNFACPRCPRTPQIHDGPRWDRMLDEARRVGVREIDLSWLPF